MIRNQSSRELSLYSSHLLRRRVEVGGFVFLVILFAHILGCVAPVFPLPPPNPTRLELDIRSDEGQVVLQGKEDPALSGAYIHLFNPHLGKGVITQADSQSGRFITDPLEAIQGDRLDLWASRQEEASQSSVLCLIVDESNSTGFKECTEDREPE